MQGTDYEEYADAMEQSYRERVSKKPVQKKDSAGAIAGVVVRARGTFMTSSRQASAAARH